MALVLPFILADLLIGWMLLRTWRHDELWLVTRVGRKDEDRALWWMSVARLAGLLALSLVGTIAAWHAR